MNRWEELWQNPAPPPVSPVPHVNGTRPTGYANAALAAEIDAVANTPQGSRNGRLNLATFNLGQLVAGGALDQRTVEDALYAAAATCGLTEAETLATIASGLKGGAKHPRSIPEPTPGYDPPAVSVLNEQEQAAEDGFWDARPVLAHLFVYAKARYVSPWAVLGCTLARVVTATPPTVLLPPLVGGYASLNTFIGLVGGSGDGKGGAEAVAAEAFDVGHITIIKTGSGEGIAGGYMKRTKEGLEQHTVAVLFSVPEIDTLTALGGRQGATLLPELRSGWSGELLGFAYVDPAKRLPVPAHQYRMAMVTGIQPGRAGPLINSTDAGTPQRFLWLPTLDRDALDNPPDAPIPIVWEPPKFGRMTGLRSIHGTAMDVATVAAETIRQARLDRLRGVGEALDGHALLTRLKAAAALALLDTRLDVNDDDWDLAGVISRRSDATRAGVTAALAAAAKAANVGRAEAEATRAITVDDRKYEDMMQRIAATAMRAMRKHGGNGEWVPSATIRTAVAARDRGHALNAIERLIEAGQLDEEMTTGGHQRGVKYRLREAR